MITEAELYEWQKPLLLEGYNKFRAQRVLLNAMPTGSGKTYISTALLHKVGVQNPLIICPKTVIPAWRTLTDGMNARIINWEKLKRDRSTWDPRLMTWVFAAGQPDVVLIDEVHRGCSGQTTMIGYMLAKLVAGKMPVIMQSATVADSPLKMRSIGFALGLHDYSKGGFFRFCREHGCRDAQLFNRTFLEFPSSPDKAKPHLEKLRQKIADKLLYIPLANIPGFPDNLVEIDLVDLAGTQSESLMALANQIEMDNPEQGVLTELLRKRQHAELLKLDYLIEQIKDNLEEGRSIAVFLNFRKSLEYMEKELARSGIQSVQIHGAQNDTDRARAIQMFQDNNVFVCLAMIQAGGVAISLHDVHQVRPRVSFINPGFSASELVQAMGRIRRAGGTRTVQRIVLTAGTIENKVYNRVQQKIRNIDTLTDGDLSWDDATEIGSSTKRGASSHNKRKAVQHEPQSSADYASAD